MKNDDLIYLELDEVIELHNALIKRYGGCEGITKKGQLDSVLEHIKINNYYPSIIEKATHLFFGIDKFHCFVDGNKRTAIATTYRFLSSNGIEIIEFEEKMENVAIDVADGKIEKIDLLEIFKLIL